MQIARLYFVFAALASFIFYLVLAAYSKREERPKLTGEIICLEADPRLDSKKRNTIHREVASAETAHPARSISATQSSLSRFTTRYPDLEDCPDHWLNDTDKKKFRGQPKKAGQRILPVIDSCQS